MRAAALFLGLAIAATVITGAQCVVACVRPVPPPCHHSPDQPAKFCDSSFVLGEKQPVNVVEAPAVAAMVDAPHPLMAVPSCALPELASAGLRRHRPGEILPDILRI